MEKSPYHILLRPIVTEKAIADRGARQQYTFQVATSSNKREIKWAVEAAYGVNVVSVNTILNKGKRRFSRMRGARPGKRADLKKAIVTLAEGQEIETT